jgi:hypothetical protein
VTKLSDETVDCPVKYRLFAYDTVKAEWVIWDNLVKDLIAEKGDYLNSEVTFNTDNGNMYARFSNFDIAALSNYFFDGATTMIEFKIGSFVVGSTDEGAGASIENLVTADITFTLVDLTTVADCADNKLTLTDLTLDDEYRTIDEIVLATGGNKSNTVVKGKKVKSHIDGCPTTTVVEFLDPMEYYWHEMRQSDYMTIDMANLQFTATYDQKWLLETALGKYYYFDSTMAAGVLPDQIYIVGQFRTTDDTNPEKEIVDMFEILITSSGETEADLCTDAFAALSFLEGSEMTVPRTYEVTDDNETKQIYIPTTVVGLETLGSCGGQVHLTLDY